MHSDHTWKADGSCILKNLRFFLRPPARFGAFHAAQRCRHAPTSQLKGTTASFGRSGRCRQNRAMFEYSKLWVEEKQWYFLMTFIKSDTVSYDDLWWSHGRRHGRRHLDLIFWPSKGDQRWHPSTAGAFLAALLSSLNFVVPGVKPGSGWRMRWSGWLMLWFMWLYTLC